MTPDVSLEVRHWPAKGVPFLLIHGLASNARLWDGVAPLLADAGQRVVAVDQRGHGQSDKPDEGYDFATLTTDLLGLCEKLDLEAPVAVGQSWGANVALELGHRAPERVRGVVCVDGGTIDMSRRFPVWDEAAVTLAPPMLTGVPATEIEAYMRRAHGDWPEAGLQGALANFERRDDGTVAPWLSRDHHMVILRELWAHHPSALYPDLQTPVMLIAARPETPLTEAGQTIRRVRALRIAGDHDIHAQKPDVVAGVLLDALAEGFFG